jgi:hypothetical protein
VQVVGPVVVQWRLPGREVTRYQSTPPLPLGAGAFQETVALPLPATACNDLGALGGEAVAASVDDVPPSIAAAEIRLATITEPTSRTWRMALDPLSS